MFLWPDVFRENQLQNGKVRELAFMLDEVLFIENPDTFHFRDRVFT